MHYVQYAKINAQEHKSDLLTSILSSKYLGMLYRTAIPTETGMRNFFMLKCRRGKMIA